MELISVIIPFFNDSKYVSSALSSVARQTYRNIEVLLIDDGSSQEEFLKLQEKIKSYAGQLKIKQIRIKKSGVAAALNMGLKNSKGRWISYLDSDDAYHPQRLEILRDHCLQKKSAFAFSLIENVDRDGNRVLKESQPRYADVQNYNKLVKSTSRLSAKSAIRRGHVCKTMSNVFTDRKLYSQMSGFRNLKLLLDYDFCYRSTFFTEPVWVKEQLLKCMHRNDSYSIGYHYRMRLDAFEMKKHIAKLKLLERTHQLHDQAVLK